MILKSIAKFASLLHPYKIMPSLYEDDIMTLLHSNGPAIREICFTSPYLFNTLCSDFHVRLLQGIKENEIISKKTFVEIMTNFYFSQYHLCKYSTHLYDSSLYSCISAWQLKWNESSSPFALGLLLTELTEIIHTYRTTFFFGRHIDHNLN